MLCLSLLPGEYLTIGENVVLLFDQMSGERCKLVVNAPREIPVVRGTVLERGGAQRPDCVIDKKRWHKRELPWNRSKAQSLAAMRKLLAQMDDGDERVQTLRRQLKNMFPEEQPSKTKVSPG